MTGAILRREMLLPARQGHTFLVRGGYALLLAAAFGIALLGQLFASATNQSTAASVASVAATGRFFVNSIAVINILACLLVTPAYVAGAIAQERDRRTLQDVLLSTMSSIEIVLSMLAGRLAQVLLILASGLPLVAIGALLGGVSGSMLIALVAMTLLWLLAVGSFSLLVSVQVRRTRDAILGTYMLGVMLLFGLSVVRWVLPVTAQWQSVILGAFNPFGMLWPAWNGAAAGTMWRIMGETTLVLGSFSALAILITVWLLRPLGVRQLELKRPRTALFRRWRTHGDLDNHPMLWKEQNCPPAGRITQLLHWLGLVCAGLAAVVVLLALINLLLIRPAGWRAPWWVFEGLSLSAIWLLAWPVYLSTLLTASTAFSGERERTTWDMLLTTPLESREIVWGKLIGSLWEVRWWLLAIVLMMIHTLLSLSPATRGSSLATWDGGPVSFARALRLLMLGELLVSKGLVGLVGEVLFVLGVALRTSLSSRTSGRAVGVTILIWLGSGIGFWCLIYIVAALALGVGYLGSAFYPPWLASVGGFAVRQLTWVAPLFFGLFWSAVGLYLVRATWRVFDRMAFRMRGAEIRSLRSAVTILPAGSSGERRED